MSIILSIKNKPQISIGWGTFKYVSPKKLEEDIINEFGLMDKTLIIRKRYKERGRERIFA